MTISPIRGHAPAERIITKFGMRGRVADVIICFKFYRNRLRVSELWRAENVGLPLTLTVALTTGQHYRVACDTYVITYTFFSSPNLQVRPLNGSWRTKKPKRRGIMQGSNLWGLKELKLTFIPFLAPKMSKFYPKSGLRKFSAKTLNSGDARE